MAEFFLNLYLLAICVVNYWSVFTSVICSLSCNNTYGRRFTHLMVWSSPFGLRLGPESAITLFSHSYWIQDFWRRTLIKNEYFGCHHFFIFISLLVLWKHPCMNIPFNTCENKVNFRNGQRSSLKHLRSERRNLSGGADRWWIKVSVTSGVERWRLSREVGR